MPKSKQNLAREILTVALLLAAVAASEYWFFQLWRLDWSVPMLYGGDGIYWVGQVQRSYGELSGSLGWPFYEAAGKYDPNYDLIYDIFVWFVGLFTKDTGTVFNLYVLVIPFANALAAYAVFRMVGMRRWLSFAFGITFGMTPYVQQRMAGHMMLAACEFVPFSVLLCLWCAEDEGFNRPGKGFFKNKRNWLALAMAWGIANNGAAYYPYFTCFFLCVTALCLILRGHKWSAGVPCLVTIAEIVAWMIPDFFPMVLGILSGQGSTLTNGVYRSPVGADIYSLRISSLLLPPNGFGLQKLANWMGRYFHILATDEGPMYNENGYGYLGVVGIFGFLALLLMLLRNWDWKSRPHREAAAGRPPLAAEPSERHGAAISQHCRLWQHHWYFCAIHPRVQPHQPLHCVLRTAGRRPDGGKAADPARRKRPQKAHPRYGGAAGLRLLGAAGPFQPEI